MPPRPFLCSEVGPVDWTRRAWSCRFSAGCELGRPRYRRCPGPSDRIDRQHKWCPTDLGVKSRYRTVVLDSMTRSTARPHRFRSGVVQDVVVLVPSASMRTPDEFISPRTKDQKFVLSLASGASMYLTEGYSPRQPAPGRAAQSTSGPRASLRGFELACPPGYRPCCRHSLCLGLGVERRPQISIVRIWVAAWASPDIPHDDPPPDRNLAAKLEAICSAMNRRRSAAILPTWSFEPGRSIAGPGP